MFANNKVMNLRNSNLSSRRAHRITCVIAGSLAVAGAGMALLLNPWFATLSAVGGLWLILSPDSTNCVVHSR